MRSKSLNLQNSSGWYVCVWKGICGCMYDSNRILEKKDHVFRVVASHRFCPQSAQLDPTHRPCKNEGYVMRNCTVCRAPLWVWRSGLGVIRDKLAWQSLSYFRTLIRSSSSFPSFFGSRLWKTGHILSMSGRTLTQRSTKLTCSKSTEFVSGWY